MDGLRIRMFGGLTLEAGGEPLPPIASRSARSLLAYLVAHRHTAPTRDLLAGLFWPDMVESQARRRLSHALWQIQSVLSESAGLDGYIEASPTTIRFNGAAGTWVDTDEFEDAVALIKSDDATDRSETLDRLIVAVRLYTGDFLAGFYDDWIGLEQDRLRQSLFTALKHIVRLSKSWGEFDQALLYARRLALLDPLHEEAHREVMRLCYLIGRPNEALAQYERCISILAGEIGATPAAETVALRNEIAAGRQAPILPLSEGGRSRLFQADGTPLVGRAAERQEIIARMEDALAGRGGIVFLEGVPGAGKTRLLTECAEDANWRGLSVLWGNTAPAGIIQPYDGLRRALEDGLTELRVHQLVERMDRVWLQALAPLLPALRRWAPDLEAGATLRGGVEERDRVREAFHRTFVALAQLTPTMLVLDDLHRIDDDTLWALDALAADLAGTPLLICIAYRRLELESDPIQWQTVRGLDRTGRQSRIVLDPLSAPEARELVRRVMPDGTSGTLVSRLHEATGGNPLFMLETLRAIHERQVTEALKPPIGVQAMEIDDLPVSGTVFEMINARLQALPGEPRHTVWALAASGTGMDIDGLAEVCGLPRPQVLDAIDYLIQAGMISTKTGKYALSHDQLGRVAYAAIPADDQPDLHRRLAWRLEGDRSVDTAALGHHFRLGAVPDEAARYLEQAGREARRLSAFATARDRYLEALDEAAKAAWSATDRARLQLALEQILEVLADRDGQEALLDALEEAAGADPVLAAEVTRRRAALLAATARLDEAGKLARRALELHTDLGDTTGRAEDLQTLGAIALWGSHFPEAVDRLEAALELAPAESLLEASIRQNLCDALHHVYRFSEAQAHVDIAKAIYERSQDQRGLAGALGSQGALYGQMGENAKVETTLLEATTLCETIGYRYGVAINALNLGHLYTISGRAARALRPAEQSRTVFRAMDNPRGVAMATANLANLHHALGNNETTDRLNREALTLFEALDNLAGAALCLGTMAEIERRRGNLPAAWSALERGLAASSDSGAGNARFQLRRTEAHLHLDAGDTDEGLRIAEEAHGACATAGADWLLPDLAVPLARALLLDGQAARVLEITADHNDCAQEAALLFTRMQAYELLGQQAAAHEALEAAHGALLRQLDGLSPEEVTTGLTHVPLHRDIDAAWRGSRPQTTTVRLASASAPTGRAVHPSELIDVVWTVHHPLDDDSTDRRTGRARQLQRLTAEAEAVGAAPTIADLAGALGVSTATVRRDIDRLRQSGHPIRTRGHRG
ncbi:MAG: AAA family ATPase [Acidimicrobiia bacterium]|nr:AAA family ATPase [Acidimicrobiia bacterium]